MQIYYRSYSKYLISLLPHVNGQTGMFPLLGFAVYTTSISTLTAYAHMRARIYMQAHSIHVRCAHSTRACMQHTHMRMPTLSLLLHHNSHIIPALSYHRKGRFENYATPEGWVYGHSCYELLGGVWVIAPFYVAEVLFLKYIFSCNCIKVELKIYRCSCIYVSSACLSTKDVIYALNKCPCDYYLPLEH